MMIAFFAVSCGPVFEGGGRNDGRGGGIWDIFRGSQSLEGTWYVNGDRNKRAEIISTGGGLEARNERGQTSRLEVNRDGTVRALDWEGGLRAEVRRDRIDWPNNVTWTRDTR